MAKYTYEIRELVSTFGRDEVKQWFSDYELSTFLTPQEIEVINNRGTWNKDQLAERIIDHFYTREIGTPRRADRAAPQETPPRAR